MGGLLCFLGLGEDVSGDALDAVLKQGSPVPLVPRPVPLGGRLHPFLLGDLRVEVLHHPATIQFNLEGFGGLSHLLLESVLMVLPLFDDARVLFSEDPH